MTFSPTSEPVDVLVVGRRHHRHLPAAPRPRGGLLRAAARGRRRRRRHLVLEPLPGRPVRLRELHVRLPLLAGAVRRVGVAGALRRASPRSSATSTTWSTGSTCGRHMRFGARVTSARVDERVRHLGGDAPTTAPIDRARFLVAATGVLSVPYLPDVPGPRRLRAACSTTPAAGRPSRSTSPASGWRWSARRRAACRSCPPSSTRSRRSPCTSARANWCTPLNNRPITADEQAAAAGRLRAAARGAQHVDPRVPPPDEPAVAPSTTRPRSASRSSSRCGRAPGFMKFTSNYVDILTNPEANAEWCEFIAGKIRGVVRRSRHRRAAHPEGPPLRREAPALRHRLLRGVQPAARVARRPARRADGAGDRDRHRDDRRRARRTT